MGAIKTQLKRLSVVKVWLSSIKQLIIKLLILLQVPLLILLSAGIVLLGLLLIYDKSFSIPLLSSIISKAIDGPTLGKIFLVIACVVLLPYRKTRRAWLEIVILFLVVLTSLTLISNRRIMPANATSPVPKTTTATAIPTNLIFDLPANKIQSDLSGLQPDSNVTLLIVANHQVHRYSAKVLQVMGVDGTAIPTPYVNEKAIAVRIQLTNAEYSTLLDFVNQLSDANAIFLLA